ncbi:tyrosine-type recombinase/integrase [Bacillus cereus]|uniref:tyrosine-type recombinase/integrase n=1 Tax=Bacillus cereus TaxID=1396 RepID=UPI000BF8F287|nr:tyrosine-type recombinase/integrase [Bacillus cereus]MDG1570398.1 tyrosine-type recombinase/integrase [Bacillus cereus]PEX21397.1 transposase [Bacillus cereus]PFT87835.1 transposase [Bacillus cereus]PGN46092.1 transposase [Bacillus cereus]PGO94831.1 transposase [Bacillus cereus]
MNLLESFSTYLKGKGRNIITIKCYILDIKQYLKWFENLYNRDFINLDRQNIVEYIHYLKNDTSLCSATIDRRISSLITFNIFLIQKSSQKKRVVFRTDMIKDKNSYNVPIKITEIDAIKFMENVCENKNKRNYKRNYAIVVMLAYTDIHTSQILSIKIKDINLKTKTCIIFNDKGKKKKIILLNNKVIYALKDYLAERGTYKEAKNSPYLFVSRKRERLDRTVINRIFGLYSDSITPSQLRKCVIKEDYNSDEFVK